MILVLPGRHGFAAQDDDRGPVLFVGFGGSSAQVGQVFKLNDAVGYRFNKHFEVAIGLPVYFVKASSTGLAEGFGSHNGIGNAYLDLRLFVRKSDWYFSSDVKGTAPTGDVNNGFSTGRATVDWTNYIERTIGRFTPFASGGIANTISDTHFFYRPFTSLGVVGHVEGGTYFELLPKVSLGGSAYADLPSGQQKVFSKLVARGRAAQPGKNGGHGRVFETQSVTVGGADTANDHGFAGWLDFNPASAVSFELGYSRSTRYALDTVFFSVGFDLGKIIRRAGH